MLEYLNQNFATLDSLQGLEKAIQDFDQEIAIVDSEIKTVIREQALAAETAKTAKDSLNLHTRFNLQTIQAFLIIPVSAALGVAAHVMRIVPR